MAPSFQKEKVMSKKQGRKVPRQHRWDIHRSEFIDSTGCQWAVSIEFKTLEGRVVPARFLIEPYSEVSELKTDVLHDVSIQKIVKPWIDSEQEQVVRQNSRRRITPHSGRPHSDKELRTVADVYSVAYKSSLPVQRTVAQTLGISVSTAAKRIMAARQRGFIPEEMNQRRSA
jgi:hypothetical protein